MPVFSPATNNRASDRVTYISLNFIYLQKVTRSRLPKLHRRNGKRGNLNLITALVKI